MAVPKIRQTRAIYMSQDKACKNNTMNNLSRDAEKGKATTTTQQKGKATQHNSPETVIFQRKIGCLGWDSNPRPPCITS